MLEIVALAANETPGRRGFLTSSRTEAERPTPADTRADERRSPPARGIDGMKRASAVAFTLIVLFGHGRAESRPVAIEGTVVHVTDGDTLWLRPDAAGAKPRKLRLAGIDAPERCQPGGVESRAALAARVLHRRVQALPRAIDDYRRTVATLHLDGEDIGAWMVLQGHAWSHGYRHAPAPYARQEIDARTARRGVFADPQAQEPRQFRKQQGPCK